MLALSAAILLALAPTDPEPVSIPAMLETVPVVSARDAADDPAIWVHPSDPALSLIIATDKQAGLQVYDTGGLLLQSIGDGRPNNVDLRHAVRFGDSTLDLAASSDRADNAIALYSVDAASRRLEPLARIPTDLPELYGICLALGPSREPFVFVNDKDGRIQQWALSSDAGVISGAIVREVSVKSQPEGMVADEPQGALYVGEEDVGIWRFGLGAGDTAPPTLIDRTGPGGHLAADVEGLTIYDAGDGQGYLIASSQGDNAFAVYARTAPNHWLFSFRIAGGPIDGTEDTDGIDVTAAPLGPRFPFGAFIAQDGSNPGGMQNFKVVPWESIARAATPSLHVNTTLRPRP